MAVLVQPMERINTMENVFDKAGAPDRPGEGRKFDPVSRAPLEADQVYPNLALREAVQTYLDEHSWA